MTFNDLHLKYDGICLYATTVVNANMPAKIILALLNLILIAAIVVFSLEGVLLAACVFCAFEFLLVRYTLWNLYGEERLIINDVSLSYQQHYGFFTTPLQTIVFNKRVAVLCYDTVEENDQKYFKLAFESYNSKSLPEVIYHSVFHLSESDFNRFVQQFNRLFIDHLNATHEMPPIHLN